MKPSLRISSLSTSANYCYFVLLKALLLLQVRHVGLFLVHVFTTNAFQDAGTSLNNTKHFLSCHSATCFITSAILLSFYGASTVLHLLLVHRLLCNSLLLLVGRATALMGRTKFISFCSCRSSLPLGLLLNCLSQQFMIACSSSSKLNAGSCWCFCSWLTYNFCVICFICHFFFSSVIYQYYLLTVFFVDK